MRKTISSFPAQFAVFAITVIALAMLMIRYWPLGADYLYIYRPVAEHWINGQTRLYDDNALGFYNAPWTILLLVPLTWLSPHIGETMLNIASILSILIAADLVSRARPASKLFVLLAVANMHTLDLLIRGQLDGLLLLGLVLGWFAVQNHQPLLLSFALCVLGIKPPNVLLATLLILYAIRGWSRRDLFIVFSLPAVALIASVFISGPDWPLRYISFAREHPTAKHRSISIWNISGEFGLPVGPFVALAVVAAIAFVREVLHQGLTLWTLSLAVTTNLMFTVYAGGYHYLLLTPAFLLVAYHNRAWALAIYLTTFTPAIRATSSDVMHWDYIYPGLLFLALWVYATRERCIHTSQSQNRQHDRLSDSPRIPSTPA